MSSDGDRRSGPRRLGPTEDERLFSVPHPGERRREFVSSDPWRVLRIMGEFVEGFDTLAGVSSGVTFFGSARTSADDPHYRACDRDGAAVLQLPDSRSSPAVGPASWRRPTAAHGRATARRSD